MNLAGRRVLVAGAGVSGLAAARALLAQGAQVTLVDARAHSGGPLPVRPDDGRLPAGTELVVTSPGWPPTAPLLVAAAAAGVPVWGEVELAWRLKPAAQGWLAVTGTNGKTTTTGLLAAVLAAAGIPDAAAGNIGSPLTDAVRASPPARLLAVELSSFQLYWSQSIAPAAAAVLNVADDHLDWHGSARAYAAAKAKVLTSGALAVGERADAGARRLLAAHDGPVVTVGVDPPADGQLGIEAGHLVDRAFGAGRLLALDQLAVTGSHNHTNALAAAALALSQGIEPAAVARGLASYRPAGHRLAWVASHGGVDFVDDSKGTNPHASAAAILAYPRVVWIAGGLAKGVAFEPLVAAVAGHLRAAVLLGACAPDIAQAVARHAADIPVRRVDSLDDAVREAARLARPGDTVLLSPAAASMDMFTDYRHRGEVFAAAVRRWTQQSPGSGRSGPEGVR